MKIDVQTNIKEVRRAINGFIAKLPGGGLTVLERVARGLKARMAKPGLPITYPVQWDSEKQRRAFFATNGFGHGIPYKRSNKYIQSGQVQRFTDKVTFFNPHPAGAIGGKLGGWQSRIHRGRWPNITKELFAELEALPEKLLNMIRVIAGKQ